MPRPPADRRPATSDADRPPAVLVVEHELRESGATRLVLGLVAAWRAGGVPVQLLSLHRTRPEDRAPVPEGVEVVHPARRELRHRGLLTTGVLRCALLARRADVVVAGREIGWGLLVSRAASWLARRPFVVLVQSEPGAAIEEHVSPRLRPLTRRALTSADRVVCVSPGLVPAAEALGIARDRISVVLNGVDVEALRVTSPAAASSLPAGEGPLVVAVGRLVRQKGFDVLLRAFADVAQRMPGATLRIVGDGPLRDELEALVVELGLVDRVHLLGAAAHEEVLEEMSRTAVFVLACRVLPNGESDAMPVVVREAMVRGRPVVAGAVAGIPESVDDEVGWLVPPEDVQALAAALEDALDDPEAARRRGAAGRRRALELWSLETCREQLEAVWAAMDASPTGGKPR